MQGSNNGISEPRYFGLFYSNISSLSPHAKEYLSSLPQEIHAISVCECHKDDRIAVESFFRTIGYAANYNVAEKTNSYNHGGECVAIRNHIISRSIQKPVFKLIKEFFQCELRFSARIVAFKQSDIIIINAYLWVSEGFSERNQIILRSIHMLAKILKLPWVAVGDWNIPFEEFQKSEWCSFLECDAIDPLVKTTTSMSLKRAIDYALISKGIKQKYAKQKPIYTVPWGPHFGSILYLHLDSIIVEGNVQSIPKQLPMDKFNEIWGYFNEDEQNRLMKMAQKRASKLLIKQHKKTGIAILGKPVSALKHDPKFQNELLAQSIKNGETLAKAALTAELVVLDVCRIPRKEQHEYVGRSQYPKFKNKKMKFYKVKQNDKCEHLVYWSELRGILTSLKISFANKQMHDQ